MTVVASRQAVRGMRGGKCTKGTSTSNHTDETKVLIFLKSQWDKLKFKRKKKKKEDTSVFLMQTSKLLFMFETFHLKVMLKYHGHRAGVLTIMNTA